MVKVHYRFGKGKDYRLHAGFDRRRWTLLVLRDLFLGKTRYDEFLASPVGWTTS